MEPLPLPFDTLPHDINKLIGSYLSCEDRVSFFCVLPSNEDKYTKKLECNKHHELVKTNEVRSLLNRIEEASGNANKQAILMIKLFNMFRKSKDTWYHRHEKFVRIVYAKICAYSDKQNPQLVYVQSKRIRNGLLRSAIMCKATFNIRFTCKQLGISVE